MDQAQAALAAPSQCLQAALAAPSQCLAAMALKRGVSHAPRRRPRPVVVPDRDDDTEDDEPQLPVFFGSQPERAGTAATRPRAKS